MWMCAMVAGPVSFAKVSFHLSVVPLSVALNRPCAALFLTTCFGTSCPDDRAAVQTVVRVAADDSAESASAQTASAANSVTSFLMVSSLRLLDPPRRPIEPRRHLCDRSPSPFDDCDRLHSQPKMISIERSQVIAASQPFRFVLAAVSTYGYPLAVRAAFRPSA